MDHRRPQARCMRLSRGRGVSLSFCNACSASQRQRRQMIPSRSAWTEAERACIAIQQCKCSQHQKFQGSCYRKAAVCSGVFMCICSTILASAARATSLKGALQFTVQLHDEGLPWQAPSAQIDSSIERDWPQVIKKQLQDGVDIRRVGLVAGGAPPRQHAEILTEAGDKVGSHEHVTPCRALIPAMF